MLAALWLLLLGGTVYARQEFLDPDDAFRLQVRAADSRTVELRYTVAPGYYLYRERFDIESAPVGVTFDPIPYPAGKVKFDETFAKDVETYRDTLVLPVTIVAAPARFKLTVTSQGCADKGLCYPPRPQVLDIAVSDGAIQSVRLLADAEGEAWTPPMQAAAPLGPARAVASPAVADGTPSGTADDRMGAVLRSGRWWVVVGAFLLAGMLLSLTPCVLPMLPILSSIIVGDAAGSQGPPSRGRGLALSLSYSAGMALVYTALGVAAGLAGEGLAAALQTPWVLASFALLLVGLSLSMFGFYELQLPASWQSAMDARSRQLPGGRHLGVFVMGGLSALIVGPCVAAPLAGALVYISQTRDVVLGGLALFSLATGMSVPLLLVGASAGQLLPRTGAWMESVKRLFGMVLLGVAIWMVLPVLPTMAVMMLAGLWCVLAAVLLWRDTRAAAAVPRTIARLIVAALLATGSAEIAGALSGGRDLLRPVAHWFRNEVGVDHADLRPFRTIKTSAELDAILHQAGQPVLLDFYADWCVACKEMERYTFPDARVQTRFGRAVLLRADVTANDADDKALLRRFGLFGPPGIVFFDASGQELRQARVIGYEPAEDFDRSLSRAGL